MRILPLATLVLLAGPTACGSTPAPVAPNGQQGDVKLAPAQASASAAFDLSPVPEPADVIGVLRWSNPAATLSNLAACTGLPQALADANAQLLVSSTLKELVGGAVDTRQLGAVVALDAPAHVLVALDSSSKRSKPIAAMSLGLSSLERAKGVVEENATLTEAGPGLWKISGREPSSSSCFIAASAGSTPARLLCGERDRDVTALGPYLARTLPTLPLEGRDAQGELRFTALSAKFGDLARQQLRGLPILAQSQLSIGEPQFDRALGDASNALQDELIALIGEADKATIDLRVDGATCLNVTASFSLRGQTSWLAGTIADSAGRAGPAPALYWRLPKDSDTAFFGHSGDPARYAGIVKTLRAMLEGWLQKENVGKPADRKAIAELISLPLDQPTSSVSASGHVAATPAPPKGGKVTPDEAMKGFLGGLFGWHLIGIDAAPDALIKYLKNAVAAYNAPGVRARLPDIDIDPKELPTIKTVPAPKELGKSALAIEITFKNLPSLDAPPGKGPGAKPKPVSLTAHVLLMGEDKATWIAFGQDKRELLKRLAAVKEGAPDAERLASRPGLDLLKTAKLGSGGFVTLTPFTRAFQDGIEFASTAAGSAGVSSMPAGMQQLSGALSNLPHKGEGLMFMTTQAQAGGSPRAELSFTLTKPALEDIGALVLAGLKAAGVSKP